MMLFEWFRSNESARRGPGGRVPVRVSSSATGSSGAIALDREPSRR